MDAAASGGIMSAGRNAAAYGEVVWPWRRDPGVYPARLCGPGNGDNKGRSPGRARISRKAIARGRPGCLGCTCQTRVRSFYHCTRCCGRSRRPAFPAPSVSEGATNSQNSDNPCRENEHACLSTGIARSEARTRLRLLRKLRRARSPPKLGERRRKQSSFAAAAKEVGLL